MSLARSLLHRAQAFLPEGGGGLCVLCYHLVGGSTPSPVDLPEPVFRRQMRELRELADVVPLHEAIAGVAQNQFNRRLQAVLTFDDAYENFYSTVWPILEELTLPATLFVPAGFVDGKTPPPMQGSRDLPAATWGQLTEMVATSRLTVGSHSWSHPDLRTLSRDDAVDELDRSRKVLEDRLGTSVDSFCYPRGLWSRRVEGYVGEGYRIAAMGGGRRLTAKNLRPLRLWRVPMRRDMPQSLAPTLACSVWLEEWLADKVRRYGRRAVA